MNVSNDAIITQLEKIMGSRVLHGSEPLKAFLSYIVTQTLEGQGNLKEYVIATEVLGRREDFNPRLDSVVRVQAGRLRNKLLEYYVTEGRDDPVIIELPKGHYKPLFSYNHPDYYDHHLKHLATAESVTAGGTPKEPYFPKLWHHLLQTPEPILIVFSNTIFHGTNQAGFQLFNSLANQPAEPSPALPHAYETALRHLPRIDHYTGIGEAMGLSYLSDFFAKIQHPYRVKRSLLLTWDDARTENLVVLGSPAENLFLTDLPRPQNFNFCWMLDEQQHEVNAILNAHPLPGEQPYYLASHFGESPSQISEDYAVISSLTGLSRSNRLLILAGINTYGTQAAAEYVTRPEYIRDLSDRLNLAPIGQPPQLPTDYQIVLKVKVCGGVPIDISYVTHRVLQA
jgi:hypothetical protein